MKAYRFLAYMIAVLVVVQAAAIAWAYTGMGTWIRDDGGVLNKELFECTEDCESLFTAEWGFAIHMFFNGFVLIPLTSLVLLIVSFFAKVPRGITLAATLFGLVILQAIVLPALSREVGPGFGAVHGLNAMVILGLAYMSGKRASATIAAPTVEEPAIAPPATV